MALADAAAAAPPAPTSATSFTTADAAALAPRSTSGRSDVAAAAASGGSASSLFGGPPSFSLGPLELHGGCLLRSAKLRKRVDLTDRLAALVGFSYDLRSRSPSPAAALLYRLDEQASSKSRLELDAAGRLLARKGWKLQLGPARVGLAAEASLRLPPLAGGFRSWAGGSWAGGRPAGGGTWREALRPDLHVSLESVSPLKYELIGIGAALLLNLPIKLNNKEVELPLPCGLGRLKGYGLASLQRSGFMRWRLAASEAAGILDV